MPRPNVLLICVDHWSGRLIGRLGHPTVLTPTLDRIVSNGIAFTNAYTTTPSCVPARRELMTGVESRRHGDHVFNEHLPMPDLPTLAQTFRDAGYQAYAVGKLHVYPQRDRIGFDDVILNEEGRHHLGMVKDDYELYLHEQGYSGQEFAHGLSNNEYLVRPWHLPERLHPTNWTVREMSKLIVRRDPTRPAFWYMSFNHPHPPLTPLGHYLDIYRHLDIDMPFMGEWARDPDDLPHALRARPLGRDSYPEAAVRLARQAFYALSTHVDHQIRLVIGLLREEGLLDDTAIMFTCDHGDMLGNHGLYAKKLFYEDSAKIPMILMPPAARADLAGGRLDGRLAVQADVFPTLMDLCDIPVPASVEGLSLIGERRRQYIYGQHDEGATATRMVRDSRHKLIYYPAGNRTQLFDLESDPDELRDLSDDPAHADPRGRLSEVLARNLYGGDLEWLDGDRLVGMPAPDPSPYPQPSRSFGNQRGLRFK